MADELDFGFPATSTRTSSDDFTTTTMTGFADESHDYTDSAHGDNAGPAHAAGSTRFEGSDGGAASRATPLQQTICADQAGHNVGTASPRTFATAPAGARRLGTRATDLRGAALFVGGGCGESSGEIAQESPDLAGNWQNSGGLLGATAAEEAETEEERKSGTGRLHHQDAASNISSGDVGGDHSTFGAATQLQQIL